MYITCRAFNKIFKLKSWPYSSKFLDYITSNEKLQLRKVITSIFCWINTVHKIELSTRLSN